MLQLWQAWFDATRLLLEAQQVMALRLLRIATGDAGVAVEARRMVSEKAAAALISSAAASSALAEGRSLSTALKRAATPYRQRVRRNRRRLTQRGK